MADKTRNLNTWTESQYFSKIRSALRQAFRFWKPITETLKRSSRPYKGPNKRQKVEYLCSQCNQWYIKKNIEVDHIEPCGSLRSYEDIVPFLKRLTIEDLNGFRVVCKPCHRKITNESKTSKL